MKLSELKQKYVFTCKITLDEETGEFIELREPSQKEIVTLSGDSNEMLKSLEKLFPDFTGNSPERHIPRKKTFTVVI